ncbi:UPF0481 protein At3g47200-like [Quercus suber]|uniref:UPF0481 protein At3g47200-like n=1 Tax=Quercus suber TaxID=58331 RepID=UPI000D2CF804|nr:upf0481 protein [Quercus suber]
MDEEVQMEENGQQYIELVNDMTEMLKNLEPPLLTDCCIYRVPYHLRKLNEDSYTPKVVSIGPFHHGNSRLQTMEKKKVRCLNNFLEMVGLNLEDLVSTIKHLEGRIRGFYGETIQLNSNDFVKMILLDVSFILEVFRKGVESRWSIDFPPWLSHSLMEDFILLENQIPFFIIEWLYDFVPSNGLSLIQLSFSFFTDFNVQEFDPLPNMKIKHFTDLLRIFQLPFTDLLRIFQLPPQRPQSERKELIKHLYSATQLREAGVKFKVSSSNCLLELKFTNGVLEIPRIHLYDRTEILARNLVAFEQCHFLREAYITDYYLILDLLINTAHDVDLLCDKGIMFNYLGDSRAATSMVNNLNKEIVWLDMSPDYYHLCKALNEFYENPLHSWKVLKLKCKLEEGSAMAESMQRREDMQRERMNILELLRK